MIILNETRDVSLTAYLLDAGGEFKHMMKHPAVLILPGGGYQFCSAREADPVAMPYLAAGYHAFILRYSVREHAVWPNPLEDYDRAMALIRSKSEEWNIYEDKVAVIGFSAGGHLAAAAATMSKNRPDAAILGYAVTGEDVRACNPSAPDTNKAVDKDTCPCYLFSTRSDSVVHILNSIGFMQALAENNIAFESHIYAYGPHGFSTCDTSVQSADTIVCSRTPNWVPDSIGWLRDMLGEFGTNGMEPPVCKKYVTADHEAFLSIDCTFRHLMTNAAARAILEDLMSRMKGSTENAVPLDSAEMSIILNKMPLRELLAFSRVDRNIIEMIDGQLGIIPNN